MLLGAMSKLEAVVLEEQGRFAFQCMLSELAEIGDTIARMRGEITQGDETVVPKMTETLRSIEQRITTLIEVWTASETEAKTDGPDPSQRASNETTTAANLLCKLDAQPKPSLLISEIKQLHRQAEVFKSGS